MQTPIAVGTPVTPYPDDDSGPPPRMGAPLYPNVTPSTATPATNAYVTPPTQYGQAPAQHHHYAPPLPQAIGGCGARLHLSGRYVFPDPLRVRACGSSITLDTRDMLGIDRKKDVRLGAGWPFGCCFCASTLTLIAPADVAVGSDAPADCCCCCDGVKVTRSDERPTHAKAARQPAPRGLISIAGSGCCSRVHVLLLEHDQPVPVLSRFARAIGLA
jgi:hypothetical protein